MDIKEKVKSLPNSPGVYIMKDEKGEVLYVGKAENLKKRVSSYFSHASLHSDRIERLVEKVSDIAYMPASTSAEALIYENSLIKQFQPKYNVALRDDKSYPLLKLTMNDKFPRLVVTRQRKDDGAIYYGPYTSAKLLREAVRILKEIFPLRTCRRMRKDVCVDYHIKQCLGPCDGKIDEESYNGMISELELFIEGRRTELLKVIAEKMAKASAARNFEEAARLRNRLEALRSLQERTISYKPADEAEELRNLLGIKGPLERIEAFDVSNIHGEGAVGSMVYFYKARPRKSEYRHFKIKTVSRIDDYGMMREIVSRRYKRLLKEKGVFPELILIDGGRGHLNAALDELEKLKLSSIPAIGLAKEFEHIYLKAKEEPLVLPRESKALHLLERVRDEAHRFAISYHKKLLARRVALSELDNIPGIGAKRRKALLIYFGSVDNIKNASLGGLLKVEGMNEKTAKGIIEYFKR